MSITSVPVLPVDDLEAARRFYVHVLGCLPAGTDSDGSVSRRLDLEIFGQPLILCPRSEVAEAGEFLPADVPTAAFVLGVDDWCLLSERLREHGLSPEIDPGRRFSMVPGEQCAMRFADSEGNLLEFRGFAREEDLLAA